MNEPKGARSLGKFADDHGISRAQVYVELNAGRLKVRKIGKRSVVTDEDANEWRNSLPLAEPTA